MSIHIKPILTEKALNSASTGKYSFWVPVSFSKYQIKEMIEKIYGVKVVGVNTNKYKTTTRRTLRRQKATTPSRKKAIVVLKDGQKIDVFSESEQK